jgi:PASTA domain
MEGACHDSEGYEPMPTFAVTVNPSSLKGTRGSEQTIVVGATNTVVRPATARASVRAEPAMAAAWVKAKSDQLGRFPSQHSTQEYTFTLKVPTDAPAGKYTFLFDVVDVDLGDDHFGTSPALQLEVEEVVGDTGTKPPPRRWWILVAAAVLVLGVGFIVWKLFFGSKRMPDLVGRPAAEALASLETARFAIDRVDTLHQDTLRFPRGAVISQGIPPGTRLQSGYDTLRLVVQRSYAVVPPLVKLRTLEAARRLGADSLSIMLGQQESPNADDIVLETRPPAGTLAVRGQRIGVLVLTRVPCKPPACAAEVGQLLFTRRRAAANAANQEALQNWKPPSP